MTSEVSKNLRCIRMRDGAEIWLESDRVNALMVYLSHSSESKFFKMGDEMINTADITGIYTAKTMEEITRRKNGQWQCEHGKWIKKNQECDCRQGDNLRNWTKNPSVI